VDGRQSDGGGGLLGEEVFPGQAVGASDTESPEPDCAYPMLPGNAYATAVGLGAPS